MRSAVGALLSAFRFLTVLPLPRRDGAGPEDVAAGLPLFPLVGLAIGAVAAAVAVVGAMVLPLWPTAVLVVTVLAALPGGLHVDGLADTADGFLSCRPRERILEIMRDSHVGSMAVLAMVLVLLLKAACLASLASPLAWRAALLAPLAGRTAILVAMASLPYARASGGRASAFYARPLRIPAALAVVQLLAGAALLAGGPGIAAAAAALAITVALSAVSRRKIGGATGDTLGAACELGETAVLLVLASPWVQGHLGAPP